MKATIFYLALLFLMASDCVYGQQQGCIENDRFANACTSTVSAGGCPTWTNECGDGWIRSHGTPNIGTYQYEIKGQIRTGYLAYMWSKSSSDGEGMFTPYLFKKGHSYDVTLTVATTANAAGSIKIYAANGLVQGGLSLCGGPPPSNIYKVPIGEYPGSTNGEIDISFTFVNNTPVDLTQIWIYPEGSNGSQYELFVKWVEVCPSCSGEIVYNQGIVNTPITRVGKISAGSSAGAGGSGVVTVAGNVGFYATQEIRLLPEFSANSANGNFIAKVDQCYLLPARRETRTPISSLVRPYDDFQKSTTPGPENKVTIYPSVTSGPVYITTGGQELQNAEIMVFDQLGKKVLTLPKANYSGKAQINLGILSNGIYILQIKQPTTTMTQKVIVQK